MSTIEQRHHDLLASLQAAAGRQGQRLPRLLAVSKFQPVAAIAALRDAGQRAFGENYVQEAMAKQRELADRDIEWHLIGHLQTNKAREAARHFDWVQSVDRQRLVDALTRERPADLPPLNVLVQVNVDDETSKSGCRIDEAEALCSAIATHPNLRLRGLMAIPAPHPDLEVRRTAFRRMRALFDQLKVAHPGMDTLSLGMSDDAELAIAEGSTMVRIGTALFGQRENRSHSDH
ncbi:YggS family pyridoxal phosphate-dependent enzyme [Solilutibacter silvestris]|uniref:Pyridoxal phosphate homeostasis protein n=1 Tax=Solilutibacter silvestris TaxID=1645665 RepID=A0A2K1PXD7_9GAMM|nr:YggS family pyridoxal phosphate-dependent enzyme [Lysobacter silvestris]PNS07453.1 pyridoxal phosphate enzyme [Lysobacter silvestris]